jgi:hypothetical protein
LAKKKHIRLKILKILASGPRTFSELCDLCDANPKSVDSQLDALKRDGLVQKEDVPTERSLKEKNKDLRTRGRYYATVKGVVAQEKELMQKVPRKPLSYSEPITFEMPGWKHSAVIEGYERETGRHIPAPPAASLQLYSDQFSREELTSLATKRFQAEFQLLLKNFVDRVANETHALVSGHILFDDVTRLPPEDPKVIRERDPFRRNIAWFSHAYDFILGASFEYNGHDWHIERQEDWPKLRDWAHAKDKELNANLDRTIEYLEKNAEDFLREQTLNGVYTNEFLIQYAKNDENNPICFDPNDVFKKDVGFGFSSDTARTLIEEGKLEIKQSTVYWLALTKEGVSELGQRFPEMFASDNESQALPETTTT